MTRVIIFVVFVKLKQFEDSFFFKLNGGQCVLSNVGSLPI